MEEAFHLIEVERHGRAEDLRVTFKFNEKQAAACLKANGVGSLPVAVISVTGRRSIGKSFLLDFFLRYAIHRYKNGRGDERWLGDDASLLKGFQWRNPRTSGILLWPEFFIAKKTNGEKVAILLMDTQGNFDDKSRSQMSSGIFALSSLASSLQIYNVIARLGDADLTHLENFCFFTKVVSKFNDNPLFQELLFLVRDWSEFNGKYGFEAGQAYFEEEVLGGVKEPRRLKTCRNVLSYFEDVSCFLMPDPGATLTVQDQGGVSVIRKEFVEQLDKLVPITLSPEKLVVKRVNGEIITVEKLFNHLKKCVNLLNTSNVPAMTVMPNTTLEMSLLQAKKHALKLYIRHITVIIESQKYLYPDMLEEAHEEAMETAINFFDLAVKAGDASHASADYKHALVVAINHQYEVYVRRNEENNPRTASLLALPLVCVPIMITAIVFDKYHMFTTPALYNLSVYAFWLSVFGLCYWCFLTYSVFVKGKARVIANMTAWILIVSLYHNTLLRQKRRLIEAFFELKAWLT